MPVRRIKPQDIFSLRPQCHANPNLVAPQRHRMQGQNPRQAQSGKPERSHCKQPQQREGQPLAATERVISCSTKHGEIVAMLKQDHGIGHGYANLDRPPGAGLRRLVRGQGRRGDLVAEQYAGPKAALRSIYDLLAKKSRRSGAMWSSRRRRRTSACGARSDFWPDPALHGDARRRGL